MNKYGCSLCGKATMNKVISLLILMIMLCMLVACGSKEAASPSEADAAPLASQSSATDEKKSEGTSENSVTAEQATADTPSPAKATVTLDYASDELLAQKDEYDKYDDTDSEYRVNAVFTTNIAVNGFKYVSLKYDDSSSANGDITFQVEKALYTQNKLTPEKALVITMLLDGAIPNRGISYIDGNGTARYFTISMSGQDDSLMLTEFTPTA